MTKNRFDLNSERLTTTDEQGKRIFLFPEDVKGIWKKRRTLLSRALIFIYLILPWIYTKGKPLLMINLAKREFTFVGHTLYGIEPVLFFLIVISLLFFIAFITSVAGRVWCGWACPQTVFIQDLFLKIEQWIEGKARARRELDSAPWSLNKILKKTTKWFIFTLVSLHISHTFLGYFVGPRELILITLKSPLENLTLFLWMLSITLIVLVDFGWFREQFCLIACPYGRMQSVMMDERSLVILYDQKRGEPRRGPTTLGENEVSGDCINCYHCVKVCPTGIDIRQGTQLECIACTHCIDACDEIMDKIKKPRGLIRYSSEKALKGGNNSPFTLRSFIYLGLCSLFILAFIVSLQQVKNLNFIFIRGNIPFTYGPEDQLVSNQFQIKFIWHNEEKINIELKISNQEDQNNFKIITPISPILIDKHEKKIVVFFRFHKNELYHGKAKIRVAAIDVTTKRKLQEKEVTLVGPESL